MRWLALLAAIALVGGCRGDDAPRRRRPHPARTLVIGLMPEENIFREVERYQPLADYLGEKIDARVDLKVLSRYGHVTDTFKMEHLDGAFFGSFAYVLAHAKMGVTVLARPESPAGVSRYRGLVFVRRDSGITRPLELRGRRFAFVDRATMAGYLLPLDVFRQAGVTDLRHFLGEAYFAGTHEAAIEDVLDGKADAGAAKSSVFERLNARDPRVMRDLAIIASSPEVPENALALRGDLDQRLRDEVFRALVEMHEDPEGQQVLAAFGARRFVATTDGDYEVIYGYARGIGLDLAAYDDNGP
jgi:phosphonate transport system substrate-binding protein